MLGKLAILAFLLYAVGCPTDQSKNAQEDNKAEALLADQEVNDHGSIEKLSEEELLKQIAQLEGSIRDNEPEVDCHRKCAEELMREAPLSDDARSVVMLYLNELRKLHNIRAKLYRLKKELIQRNVQ